MEQTYLAITRLAQDRGTDLTTARRGPLLNRSRLSAYLASIISEQFALSSFSFYDSVNRHSDGPVNQLNNWLVSLRSSREIVCILGWLSLLVL